MEDLLYTWYMKVQKKANKNTTMDIRSSLHKVHEGASDYSIATNTRLKEGC